MSEVPTVELAGGGAIPQLGFGTWEIRGRSCQRAVAEALEAGYRHIDTAEGYRNEEDIGAAIAGHDREELWLASKAWRAHLRSEDLRRACEGSLRRLGTEYLDLYLVHWPNSDIPIEDTIAGMRSLREAGKVRAWGVSNFTPSHLEEAVEVETPGTNQVELHPFFAQKRLTEACDDLGIPITAYSPIARGRVFENETLVGIAAAHGKEASQIALRWAIQRGHIVIPRSSDPDHIRSNAAIFDFGLHADAMARIDGLPQGDRLVDGDWSEFDR